MKSTKNLRSTVKNYKNICGSPIEHSLEFTLVLHDSAQPSLYRPSCWPSSEFCRPFISPCLRQAFAYFICYSMSSFITFAAPYCPHLSSCMPSRPVSSHISVASSGVSSVIDINLNPHWMTLPWWPRYSIVSISFFASMLLRVAWPGRMSYLGNMAELEPILGRVVYYA